MDSRSFLRTARQILEDTVHEIVNEQTNVDSGHEELGHPIILNNTDFDDENDLWQRNYMNSEDMWVEFDEFDEMEEDDPYPLTTAVAQKDEDTVTALLDARADVNILGDWCVTPICVAVADHSFRIADLLLEARADVDIPDRDGMSPLMAMLITNNTAAIKYLLTARANVEVRRGGGLTALQVAVDMGKAGIVRALLDAGADVNARADMHETCLFYLNRCSTPQLRDILIGAGASLTARDVYGNTALMHAADHGERHALSLLMDTGVDVHCVNKRGENLMLICARKDLLEEMRTCVVKYGMSLRASDNQGNTALMYAARSLSPRMLSFVLDYLPTDILQAEQRAGRKHREEGGSDCEEAVPLVKRKKNDAGQESDE